MKPTRFVLALLALAAAASACIPTPVDDECQKIIHACLRDCPSEAEGDGLHQPSDNDFRNTCESRCHELCK